MNMFNKLLVLFTSYFIFLETSEGFLTIFTAKNTAKSKRAVRQEHQTLVYIVHMGNGLCTGRKCSYKSHRTQDIKHFLISSKTNPRTLSLTIAGPVRRRSCSSRIMNPQQPDQDALQALPALAPLNPAQVPPAPDANPAPVANNPAQPDQVAANQPNEVNMLSWFYYHFCFIPCDVHPLAPLTASPCF